MSWFKRGRNDSKLSSRSGSSDCLSDARPRSETDPQTCLEVFKNHWNQAHNIIKKGPINYKGQQAIDDIDTVFQNLEQMMTLLAAEEGLDDNGQGMPGAILHYLLEHEIFEKISTWCHSHKENSEKMVLEQLRLYEQLISQSHQILLIHKPVIQPLLKLLSSCEGIQNSSEIQYRLVLVLHQVCVCISQQTLILESFFSIDANHGPAKFLIFSLLIPFIHREGRIGQQARDALLLIMSLSSKHPHIGQYIAENSDFCPVLATGLSGLYSSLPRKIMYPTEDWSGISQRDISAISELQMFLNSLEFCNAVVQISDSQVRSQLIHYIYDGFLVPVLGPALHQDVSGLPLPLLDSPMFSNSREEVIAATAYLELFLRKITEPALIQAFIRFILTEQNDEIVILDSLITRINSSSRLLCSASLVLFKSLVDLNCEDVMFEIIFKHLIPCTHVMVSQRRAIKDLDLYSHSAERFLSLRPTCLSVPTAQQEVPKSSETDPDRFQTTKSTALRPKRGLSSFLLARKKELELRKVRSKSNSYESYKTITSTNAGKLEQFEMNYMDYLSEAKVLLENCCKACLVWTYPYNGENPPHEVFNDLLSPDGSRTLSPDSKWSDSEVHTLKNDSETKNCDNKVSGIDSICSSSSQLSSVKDCSNGSTMNLTCSTSADDVFLSDMSLTRSTIPDVSEVLRRIDWSCLDDSGAPSEDNSEFLDYLQDVGTPPEEDSSIQISIQSLGSIFSSLQSISNSQTSVPNVDNSDISKTEDSSISQCLSLNKSSGDKNSVENDKKLTEKSIEVESARFECGDGTAFEVIDSISKPVGNKGDNKASSSSEDCKSQTNDRQVKTPDETSYLEITMSALPHSNSLPNDITTTQNPNSTQCSNASNDSSSRRSVSFSLPPSSMQNSVAKVPSVGSLANAPSIGPFLTALLTKLEGMIQNPKAVNFLLTGIISRLAAFPQPLLRSFLLSHNLVFQPNVKSLLQVLASVRQKVDHCSYTIPSFEQLLTKARITLITKEENWQKGIDINHFQNTVVPVSAPPPEPVVREKRKLSITDLLFRRGPNSQRNPTNLKGKGAQLQIIPGGKGYRYVNQRQPSIPDNRDPMDSPKTHNSVYCAVILDEFVKELAAICQEHAVLIFDDGYHSN